MIKALIVSEGPHESGGALEVLVTRLATSELRCEPERMACQEIHAHHGKGQGFFKRAIRWLLEARKRGFDALILVVDEDGQSGRVRDIAAAQAYENVSLRRALGVAIRTFDAWMLADERALTTVLRYQVARQPAPENNMDPKQACADLQVRGEHGMTQTQMYAAVAAHVDIGTLEQRCPRGFAPFAKRVRGL